MRESLISLAFALSITTMSVAQVKISDPVDYVNPLMGTDSKPSLSRFYEQKRGEVIHASIASFIRKV